MFVYFMPMHESSHPSKIQEEDDSPLDYRKVSRIFDEFSLDAFFSLNTIPSLKKYPHFDTFKNGFPSLTSSINNNSEDDIDDYSQLERNKIGKNAIKYYNSHCIIKLFTGYFHLFEFHHRVSENNPEIFEKFLSVILKVFSSMEKNKLEDMLKEISINSKMHEFYIELYKIWEEEKNNKEKEYLLI